MTYLCSIIFIFVTSVDPLSKNKSRIIIQKCRNLCKQLTLPGRTVQQLPFFTTVRLYTVEITCDEVVKLLGIDIDYQLNFNYHIKNICRKASQQLNVLKRIGCFLSKLNKLTIFHTFILSNFNFCPLAWHFCNKSNTSKLEKIQARALRFIYAQNNIFCK